MSPGTAKRRLDVSNPPDTAFEPPVLVIRPSQPWAWVHFAEVWRYRELLYFLVWRDLKVRFKQTAVGVLWLLLRPTLSMIALTIVFWKLAKMPSDGVPYPVFVVVGTLGWSYFSTAVANGTSSLVGNSHLITKVYFPRIVIPSSTVISCLAETVASFCLLLALMAWYGIWPPLSSLVIVPLLLLLLMAMSLGFSLWLGALNVRWRDVGSLVPFLLQLWMYGTPVVYPLSVLPEKWRWIAMANPLCGVIEALRAALLARPWPWKPLAWSALAAAVVLLTGMMFFHQAERDFADTV